MSVSQDSPLYLTLEMVYEIHTKAIERFGGSDGIREMSLLESAVVAPQATMFGKALFNNNIEIAAAYLFYLCRNHPFLDGNKRVALGACLLFLRLNGERPQADSSAWESLTLDVAASRLGRDATTARLRELVV